MHRAVHRLEVVVDPLLTHVALGIDLCIELHRRVHALGVPLEVARLLEQRAFRDVRGVDELVAALLVALARVVLHDPAHDPALRVEDSKARPDLLGEREQVEFGAEAAMVAALGLLEEGQVRLQVVLARPAGAIYPLERLILLVAEPVGRRRAHELEGIGDDVAGIGHMRPAAQVAPAALAGLRIDVVVDGELGAADLHDIGTALASDETKLERLIAELDRGRALFDDPAREPLPRFHDDDHALLEDLEVLRGERPIDVEVVVEAILDRRPDAELRLRKRVLDRLGEHVGGRVAKHGEALWRIHRHRFDHIGVGDLSREIAQFAIDACHDNGLVAAHSVEGSCGHRVLLVQCVASPKAERVED